MKNHFLSMDCILIYNEMQALEMFYFSNKFYLQQF